MKLIIKYELIGISRITEADELCKVRDGFWVDTDGKFCMSKDSAEYILPHMIHRIHKAEEEKFEEVVDADFDVKEANDGRSDHKD
jgi:Na+-transporting NADH:ubiquinone oxidoreductase subunit NqrD